ncbi:glycosyltransferase [Winogradskyella sp. PE311]|uniref:glycosyltransferase n=1 Tax=Winogradskyella sp. PE311 TaxID=3366943 RepID=UPI00397FC5C9
MITVIQIIDTLEAGGAERLSVNYANGLCKLGVASHLCATRFEGVLKDTISDEVDYLFLNRKSTLDISAVFRLKNYIRRNEINIIHAHSSSFFLATLVKIIIPKVKIIWHDHYGNSENSQNRPKKVLRFCSRLFSYIFSVNSKLKEWSKMNLLCNNVECIKNFPVLKEQHSNLTKLKGIDGKRILCLANLREQKNHSMLLEAFSIVKVKYKDWSLHCVGKDFNDDYSNSFFKKIEELNLKDGVHFYDSKSDILNIMKQCEIGVLSSKSEGLPLALLEYGMAKLPVVVTNVGSCGLLINDADNGYLIENGDVNAFAKSILEFIGNEDYRLSCANNFSKKVSELYSQESILSDVVGIYKTIL